MMSIYALQNIPKAFNRQYLNRKRDKEKEKMRRGKREEGGRKKKKKKRRWIGKRNEDWNGHVHHPVDGYMLSLE